MKRALLVLSVLCSAAAAQAPDAWAPWRFLIGHWDAAGGGASQQGQGWFSFELQPGTGSLVRRNHADYPPQGGNAAYTHDDLMVIAPEGAGWRATYVDDEGHVIIYTSIVTQDQPPGIIFSSDPAAPGPRYRLTYKATGPSAVDGTFEMGSHVYREWTGVRH